MKSYLSISLMLFLLGSFSSHANAFYYKNIDDGEHQLPSLVYPSVKSMDFSITREPGELGKMPSIQCSVRSDRGYSYPAAWYYYWNNESSFRIYQLAPIADTTHYPYVCGTNLCTQKRLKADFVEAAHHQYVKAIFIRCISVAPTSAR